MCQQKRLNIGLEHNPGYIGVKRYKVVLRYLESFLGYWNILCIDRMSRYKMEHHRRKRIAREKLTLIDESLGSNWD